MAREQSRDGFTLIEMSIVLVIIGLIVGGVLVGQDLIRASEVRAQISQIEKYNTAVNTFRGKYGAIPGDMNVTTAEQFGFTVGFQCDGTQGRRDGNGLIDGWDSSTMGYFQWQGEGETELFWQDISSAHLIDGTFPASGGLGCYSPGALTNAELYIYFPAAKIGHGNWVYVYETNGANWFGLLAFTSTDQNGTLMANGSYQSGYTIPVAEAYAIDKKVDDGLPTAGNVQAFYSQDYNPGAGITNSPNAATDTSTTCYNTTTNTYSLTVNGGAGANCALSFMFQ